MQWHRIILNLLDGIDDPEERIDMMTSIVYILQLLEENSITRDQAINDIAEVVVDALRAKNPMMTAEEAMEEAIKISEEIIRAWIGRKRRVEKTEKYGLLGKRRRM